MGKFLPTVGNSTFEGSINGEGYKIIDLYINQENQNNIGLFGTVTEQMKINNYNILLF